MDRNRNAGALFQRSNLAVKRWSSPRSGRQPGTANLFRPLCRLTILDYHQSQGFASKLAPPYAIRISMKRCPQCNRVETDNTLKFCRVDGATLKDSSSLTSSSEIETSILPDNTDAVIDRSTAQTTAQSNRVSRVACLSET